MSRCRALIFPGKEDFGIVPVEVMASGRPVIAYGRGGALETVLENRTGIFFDEQTVPCLNAAVDEFEKNTEKFLSDQIVAHARCYNPDRFKEQFQNFVDDKLK